MAQAFHPSSNTISRISILFVVLVLGLCGWSIDAIVRSSYATQADVVRNQPIPFSHQHHVQQIGIDCRYCHTSVESSSSAGIPSTETCIGCHSQILADSPMLEPIRKSFRENRPIHWTRVHDLPDFVYFDHSIHVAKGVACVQCHGEVNAMPLMWRNATLHMDWCLECHRDPARFIRPTDQVFSAPLPKAGSIDDRSGEELVAEYGIENGTKISNCSTCHR